MERCQKVILCHQRGVTKQIVWNTKKSWAPYDIGRKGVWVLNIATICIGGH